MASLTYDVSDGPSLKRQSSQLEMYSKQTKIPRISTKRTSPAKPFGALDDFLLKPAEDYLALLQRPNYNHDEAFSGGVEVYQAFMGAITNFETLREFLNYRGDSAQALIDALQILLDNDIVEPKLRLIYVSALVALAMHALLYPKRLILHNVVYQEPDMEDDSDDDPLADRNDSSRFVKGSLDGAVVCIMFKKRRSLSEQTWFQQLMLHAQLSHQNIQPLYGLCPSNNENYFPGLVTPWLEKIQKFSKLDPASGRSFILDVAAGFAYLENNNLIYESADTRMAIVYEYGIYYATGIHSMPAYACIDLLNSQLVFDVRGVTIFPVDNDSENKFLKLYSDLGLWREDLDHSHSPLIFALISCEILSVNIPQLYGDPFLHAEHYSSGNLYEGLDQSLWQLLKDCRSLKQSGLNASEVVSRLQVAKHSWETAIQIQKHETNFLAQLATIFLADLPLKQPTLSSIQFSDQTKELYNSFLDVFQDLSKYRHFINCRGERAQALIDAMQTLLYNNIVEQDIKIIFIMDIAAEISHLFKNGLEISPSVWEFPESQRRFRDIFVTRTAPIRAGLNIPLRGLYIEPSSLMLWSKNYDKEKFIEINSDIELLVTAEAFKVTYQKVALLFYHYACDILSYGRPFMKWLHKTLAQEKAMPSGFLQEGLDKHLWQLLLDCQSEDYSSRPNPSEIVQRLEWAGKQWNTVIQPLVQKRQTVALILRAIFSNKQYYQCLLSCNEDSTQTLLNTLQLLLDIEYFPELDRSQVIAALQRFSIKRNLYPTHFSLGTPALAMQDISPIAAGGFADIYKVMSEPHQVETCFKVIRVYQQRDVQYLTKCLDTAAGVEYLHKNNIVHGDLKGSNVLVNSSGRAAIADFGLANITDSHILKWTSQSTVMSKGGTSRWHAPELLVIESKATIDELGKVYNTKASDVFAWSNIFTGHNPFFEVSNIVHVTRMIMKGDTPTRPKDNDFAWHKHGLNEEIWDLMKNCWSLEPLHRPDITKIISRLEEQEPKDYRLPGEWDKNSSVHFRNAGKNREVQDLPEFWDDIKDLLLEVVPGLEIKEAGENI
ncbi:hypothetical protein H0H92_001563 [Tricholoma furcatifolium]|nr:hypothetical protein H0H92_001563 [Tricholoma furcatifolium]